jgi:hypothetical protein
LRLAFQFPNLPQISEPAEGLSVAFWCAGVSPSDQRIFFAIGQSPII